MRAFVFDTETTGLIQNSRIPVTRQPQVIEFYGEVVDLSTGEVIHEVDFLASARAPLDDIITRVTGLRDEDVRGHPPFAANIGRVTEAMDMCDEAVAHNMAYDRRMLAIEAQRASVYMPWPKRLTCTVAGTEHMRGYRLSLSALHQELFGEPFEGAHRARVDVKALTRCFLELRRRGDI